MGRRIDEYSRQHITNIAWALGKLNVSDRSLITTLLDRSMERLDMAAPQDAQLSRVGYGVRPGGSVKGCASSPWAVGATTRPVDRASSCNGLL